MKSSELFMTMIESTSSTCKLILPMVKKSSQHDFSGAVSKTSQEFSGAFMRASQVLSGALVSSHALS